MKYNCIRIKYLSEQKQNILHLSCFSEETYERENIISNSFFNVNCRDNENVCFRNYKMETKTNPM